MHDDDYRGGGELHIPEVVVLLLEPKPPKPPVFWVFCWPKPPLPKPPKDIVDDVAVAMEGR